MATLQDYLGITKLRDAWPKWKANIIAINTQVINHVAGTADKHAAQDITYSGSFTSMADVKAALDQAKTEIDTIVVNASVDPEVALARVSAVKSETFATLDARLESSEQDLVSYKAETAYVLDSGDLTNLSVRLGALPQNSKIMLQPNKVYNFIEPINLSKSFQIDLNGSTINYVGAGYLFNFTGLNRKNLLIENGTFTGNPALYIGNSFGFGIKRVTFNCLNVYALEMDNVLWGSFENVFFISCGFKTTPNVAVSRNNVLSFNIVEVQGGIGVTLSPLIDISSVSQINFRLLTIEGVFANKVLRVRNAKLVRFDSPWFEKLLAPDYNTDLFEFNNVRGIVIENGQMALSDAAQKHKNVFNLTNCQYFSILNSVLGLTTFPVSDFISADTSDTVIKLQNIEAQPGTFTINGGYLRIKDVVLWPGTLVQASFSKDDQSHDFDLSWTKQVPTINKIFAIGETQSGLGGVIDTTTFVKGGQSYRCDVLANTAVDGAISPSSTPLVVGDIMLVIVKLKSDNPIDINMLATGAMAIGNPRKVTLDTNWKEYAIVTAVVTVDGNYYPYFQFPSLPAPYSVWIDEIKCYKFSSAVNPTILLNTL